MDRLRAANGQDSTQLFFSLRNAKSQIKIIASRLKPGRAGSRCIR